MRIAASALAFTLAACDGRLTTSTPTSIVDASTSTVDAADAAIGLPPLESPSPFTPLQVPHFRDAVLSLPLGATTKMPVVIAAHGNYDRPEWQCETWRALLHDRAFVLCPRGVPRTDSPSKDDIRFTYDNGAAFEREIDAAIGALLTRYPDYVEPGPMLYTGFSLGAILGVPYIAKNAARFSGAVLIEGGHDAWTKERVNAFASAPSPASAERRVLFACGQGSCVADTKAPARALERAHVPTKVVYGAGVGHGYTGAVATAIAGELEWVFPAPPR